MQPISIALLAGGLAALASPAKPLGDQAAAQRLVLQRAERLADDFLKSAAEGGGDECAFTAGLAQIAEVHGLQADLSLALASCVNEESGSFDKFQECLQEAFAEFAEGLEELGEIQEGRLELCALTGGGIYDPDLDEDEFVEGVDHTFLPYKPGAEWIYHANTDEGLEVITVTVTGETREVDDIECIVVRDVVTLNGEFVEDTDDWYAQHEDGAVWYMGEIAKNYEDGELVDLEGSWEAGEDGALPGIVMMSTPVIGTTYRQELLYTEAEDAGTVLALDARVDVPYGQFLGCLKTADFTPLEPDTLEHKYYAKGVGLVLEVNPKTGERVELVSFTPGS